MLLLHQRNNLQFKKTNLDLLDKNSINLCLKVEEYLFDHEKMKKICWEKLNKFNVTVYLNTNVTDEIYKKYDLVVISTYANINSLLKNIQKNNVIINLKSAKKSLLNYPKNLKTKVL